MRGIVIGVALLVSVSAATAAPITLTVTNTSVGRDNGGTSALTLTLSPESATAFDAFTAANVGRSVDLRIDGQTVMTAFLPEPITGNTVRIAGNNLTLGQLSALAVRITTGDARVEADIAAPGATAAPPAADDPFAGQ